MTTSRYTLPEPAMFLAPALRETVVPISTDMFAGHSSVQMQAAYQAGRESMREDIAKKFDGVGFDDVAKSIRGIE
jgi:hypothetical protein